MSSLIVLSAPSGAGKTTLCRRLLGDFPQLVLSISSTTRPPRGNEKHGVEYYFVPRDEFERQIAAGRFAEWAEVHGHLYGTSKDTIDDGLARGRSVLLDIDVQGAASLAAAYPDRCLRVFVAPPSLAELERRLRARGTDSEETVQRRLRGAASEMARLGEFDRVVINDDLERAYAELRVVVAREIGVASG